jgi:hypothetical protein
MTRSRDFILLAKYIAGRYDAGRSIARSFFHDPAFKMVSSAATFNV